MGECSPSLMLVCSQAGLAPSCRSRFIVLEMCFLAWLCQVRVNCSSEAKKEKRQNPTIKKREYRDGIKS